MPIKIELIFYGFLSYISLSLSLSIFLSLSIYLSPCLFSPHSTRGCLIYFVCPFSMQDMPILYGVVSPTVSTPK